MTTDVRPRVLFVGRGRTSFPLSTTLERRNEALSREVVWRQMGTRVGAAHEDPRYALAAEPRLGPFRGLWYYLALPLRVRREIARFAPDAIIAQGAQETALVLLGRRLAGASAPVVFDVHGDWRAPTRLYGGHARRLLSPLADVLARLSLRRSDGIRTITPYTTELVRAAGREPDAEFPAYMDISAFTAAPPTPLPNAPRVLFVGVLEPYKAVDVLAEAWRRVCTRHPGAVLHVVGAGTLADVVERLADDLPGRVEWDERLTSDGVASAMDRSIALVLPSRSEGMGRVVVEAFCRARSVVGSAVGGIPDLVRDGVSGVLVPPGDADALAGAILRLLDDRALAATLSEGARASAATWAIPADVWAASVRALVDGVVRCCREGLPAPRP